MGRGGWKRQLTVTPLRALIESLSSRRSGAKRFSTAALPAALSCRKRKVLCASMMFAASSSERHCHAEATGAHAKAANKEVLRAWRNFIVRTVRFNNVREDCERS